jgi:hypothetical protein
MTSKFRAEGALGVDRSHTVDRSHIADRTRVLASDEYPLPDRTHVHDYSIDYAMRPKPTPRPCVWSYTYMWMGTKVTSMRRFDTKDDAINAICERMRMHAKDGEWPMFGLVRFKR